MVVVDELDLTNGHYNLAIQSSWERDFRWYDIGHNYIRKMKV